MSQPESHAIQALYGDITLASLAGGVWGAFLRGGMRAGVSEIGLETADQLTGEPISLLTVVRPRVNQVSRATAPRGLADGAEQLLEIGKSRAKLKLENGVLKVSDIYVQGDSMFAILDKIRKVGMDSGAKSIEVTAEFLNFPFRDSLMKMGLQFEKVGEGPFGDIWKITGGL